MTLPQQKQNRFRDAMALILQTQVEFPRSSLVTVVDAKLTSDQANAKVVLSVLPVSAEKQVLEALEIYRHDIIKKMANDLRLRHLPNIYWSFDHTEQKAEDIEAYIQELKNKGEL